MLPSDWSRVGKLMPDGSSHIQSEVVTFSQVNRYKYISFEKIF